MLAICYNLTALAKSSRLEVSSKPMVEYKKIIELPSTLPNQKAFLNYSLLINKDSITRLQEFPIHLVSL